MAPSKKTKNLVKRISITEDVSPEKDFMNLNKGKQRKRKLSNKLGPQWNKEELECFYEAFRRYGKDWRKVAAVVPNRSSEMVEALYNMNRAYLSLPEGTASVVGLIAMMTDHYNVLEGSVSEEESNDEPSMQQKFQKNSRVKFRIRMSNDDFGQSGASNDGCLSLLKRRPSDGRAVGKRTPRFPVSFPYRKGDAGNFAPPSHRVSKPSRNVSSDEVAHVAALALAEASHKGGSPQSSHTPHRKTRLSKPLPVRKMEIKSLKCRAGMLNLFPSFTNDHILEGSKGYRDVESVNFPGHGSPSMYSEGVGTAEVHKKGKKICKKKEAYDDSGDILFDDGREACSGTEEGVNIGSVKGKVDIEVSDLKKLRSPSCQRKRSKKLFADENPAFDALQALADLSLMMPGSTSESADKISAPESLSASQPGDKCELPGSGFLLPDSTVEFTTPGKSRSGMQLEVDACDTPEEKTEPMSATRSLKRKRKLLSPKVPGSEVLKESPILSQEGKRVKVLPSEDFHHFVYTQNISHASPESGSTCPVEAREVDRIQAVEEFKQNWILKKQLKELRSPDDSLAVCAGEHGTGTDFTAHIPAKGSTELPTRQRCRQRKMRQASTVIDKEKMIPNCLASPLLRRWCVFEWFYSAVDYPWFAKNEFVEYLNHAGLGHIRSLTRVEWGVIRSSLGKPRRFSERFLKEEKEKLKQYRESVRTHYSELRIGIRDGLPADLARPLAVGQRIIALHPKTREVHEGSILTIDHDRCRVQFDQPEMGVEFIMDIDCMPLNPLENIPEILKKRRTCLERVSKSEDPLPDPQPITERSPAPPSAKKPQLLCTYSDLPAPKHSSATLEMPANVQMQGDKVKPASQTPPTTADTINPQQVCYNRLPYPKREADTQALFHLARALEKKEAILMELKRTNDEVQEGRSNDESSASALRKHYAMVLVQLKEASDQVSSAVLQLRLRNTYPGAILPLWMKQPVTPGGANNLPVNGPEPGSDVVDIVKGSKAKARVMVDTAIQAMASIKQGEDAFVVIDDALSSLDQWGQPSSFSPAPTATPPAAPKPVFLANGGPSSPSSVETYSAPIDRRPHDNNHASIPADLITSCVAAFLMVQMCTERQYAPAEVAQVLDKLVGGLQPISPQNVSVYREIEMCMGKIKTQILALVPT